MNAAMLLLLLHYYGYDALQQAINAITHARTYCTIVSRERWYATFFRIATIRYDARRGSGTAGVWAS